MNNVSVAAQKEDDLSAVKSSDKGQQEEMPIVPVVIQYP